MEGASKTRRLCCLRSLFAGLVLGMGSAGCVETVSLAWLESPADRPWALAHIVKPRREEQNTRFGTALALTNRHLLVGAPVSTDCGGPIDGPTNCPEGAVNAWWRPLESGAPPVILKSSDAGTTRFGTTISASTGKIWIGAPGERNTMSGNTLGAVAEHARSGVDWSDPVEITSAGLLAGSDFGRALALAPPWGAVLAPNAPCPDQPGGKGLLQVMWFARPTGWILHESVCVDRGTPATGAMADGQWGAVAISSERLVLGVPWTKDSTVGRVLVFRLHRNPEEDAPRISFDQELGPDVATAVLADGFGVTVAVDSDRIYVGAPGEGAVYTFKFSQGRFRKEQRVVPQDSSPGFGTAIAVSQQQLLVGSSDDENCALGMDPQTWSTDCRLSRGAAFLFVLDPDKVWTQRHYIKPPRLGSSAFGAAVAILGSTFAIGAPFETTMSYGIDGEIGPRSGATGAVFVYRRNDNVDAL